MSNPAAVVAAHRWTGDDDCRCACGEDVGNDHSWALHLLASLAAAGGLVHTEEQP